MATIAIWSVKGGVGKTTLAADMAWRSAVRSGHSTLLWDLDPQGGSAWLLGIDTPRAGRASSVFHRDVQPADVMIPTRWPGLSLLPADDSLHKLPIALARIGHRRRLAHLTTRLSGQFERIILDCPPVLNEVSDQVIGAADLIIVPSPPSPLAMRALDMVRHEMVRNHQRHPPILPVLSMYDSRRRLHREVHLGLAAGWPVIPLLSPIEQAAARQQPIDLFAGLSPASQCLQRLWDGIEAKLRLRENPSR